MTKWRTLALATVSFNFAVLVWFSFAPFTGAVASAFALSLPELGLLASAAVWLVPFGRVTAGWLTDRWGATRLFAVTLAVVGVASMASAVVRDYRLFFGTRLVVALAGVAFVIGIQHVAQWFSEERVGTAEGVFAGFGNAGAAVGALLLPRVFADWSGPLFSTGWRAAFFYTGLVAVALGVVYALVGQDAATERRAERASEGATLRSWLHTATRYGAVALALGYVLSYGLEVAMNTWLPTYFRTGFRSEAVLASTFAAAFSLSAGLLRPLSGYASDRLAGAERDILPVFRGRYREQWTLVCMTALLVALCGLTVAGSTGVLAVTVAAVAVVGLTSGFTSGAIVAQIPTMFPDSSGTAAGIVGGVGTVGGVGFPLVFSAAATAGSIHAGYAVVAGVGVPVLLVTAWVSRPRVARRAGVDGLLSLDPPARHTDASSDD